MLSQPTWPEDHQARVDAFLVALPEVWNLRATTHGVGAWSGCRPRVAGHGLWPMAVPRRIRISIRPPPMALAQVERARAELAVHRSDIATDVAEAGS